MRHQVLRGKLSRDTKARRALLANLADSLFRDGKVVTTEAKAKFVQGSAEKLITSAKKKRLNINRKLASSLSHGSFIRLVEEIAPGFLQRGGGYTRIVKIGKRRGDSADMARIELLEWDVSKVNKSAEKKSKIKKVKKETKRAVLAEKKSKITKKTKAATKMKSKVKK